MGQYYSLDRVEVAAEGTDKVLLKPSSASKRVEKEEGGGFLILEAVLWKVIHEQAHDPLQHCSGVR